MLGNGAGKAMIKIRSVVKKLLKITSVTGFNREVHVSLLERKNLFGHVRTYRHYFQ